jgi:hypothetical protein
VNRKLHGRSAVAAAVLLAGLCPRPAQATQFDLGDVHVTVGGVIATGTAIRTEKPEPLLVPQANGAALGLVGIPLGGRNQDDGNLNYRRGDAVSTVTKGLIEVDAKVAGYGAFVRAMAWRDFVLADSDRPWGNLPNNYTPGIPLGESSNSAYGRYGGAALLDAYLYGSFSVAETPMHLRVGRQTIPWGVATTIPGGFSWLSPVNSPAARRPGATPEEAIIPIPAALARIGVTSTINVEAYYQFAFQRAEPFACGSFFGAGDYLADRCDKVLVGGGAMNDRQSLATGNFAKRSPDLPVSDGDQFGLGVTYKAEAIATQFGAYFAQYHSRTALVGAIKAGRVIPIIPGDPDGLNARYFVQYPENIRVFGGNAVTRLPAFTTFVEMAHRPNQPIQLYSADLSNGFLSATAPSLLRAEINALPFGATYDAYDRHATTDVIFGASKPLPGILGAKVLALSAEIGAKFVHDLPDVTQRRYGRAEIVGGGPVNGLCAAATAVACSNDGFTTSAAAGGRGRVALTYTDVLAGVDLIPSVTYGWDMYGWSYDGVFNRGRQSATFGLRAEFNKRIAAEIAFIPVWGGRYNVTRDRDVAIFSLSARF